MHSGYLQYQTHDINNWIVKKMLTTLGHSDYRVYICVNIPNLLAITMAEKPDLEKRVDTLELKIDTLIELAVSISKAQAGAGESIDSNFNILNDKIDALAKMANREFGDIKFELTKIQKVSGYSKEYENLLKVS